MIPKFRNPKNIDQHRTISLCNFIYKIILRVFVNKLKLWLNMLVHPNQAVFLLGRFIQDNILVAHEIFHDLNTSNTLFHSFALKLDTMKAYDKLE